MTFTHLHLLNKPRQEPDYVENSYWRRHQTQFKPKIYFNNLSLIWKQSIEQTTIKRGAHKHRSLHSNVDFACWKCILFSSCKRFMFKSIQDVISVNIIVSNPANHLNKKLCWFLPASKTETILCIFKRCLAKCFHNYDVFSWIVFPLSDEWNLINTKTTKHFPHKDNWIVRRADSQWTSAWKSCSYSVDVNKEIVVCKHNEQWA